MEMFTNLHSDAETPSLQCMFDYMNGVQTDTGTNTATHAWMFKRATGFFDVVAYTGTGSPQTLITIILVASRVDIIKVETQLTLGMLYNQICPALEQFIL